ncbi:MAG: cyclopropane-fatty-acyl-phospholipid synthase family protein [Candidatus Neomarinimicrobiota bacterium]
MKDQLQREVAEAFETTPELLPYIPELLADLWELGSSPELIIEWLRLLDLLPQSTRVLDLGCGKGGVAIRLARELGFQVLGVDLFEPFVQDARRRAVEMGVADLCQFVVADMHTTLEDAGEYDVVIYASVGRVLGSFDECIARLRQSVRPGGFMVIDDGFLKERTALERPGYEHYAPHEETVRQLTSHGDTLLREKVLSVDEIRAIDRHFIECIRKRAAGLARRHPEAADLLSAYIQRQEHECEIIEAEVSGAVWLLQRAC